MPKKIRRLGGQWEEFTEPPPENIHINRGTHPVTKHVAVHGSTNSERLTATLARERFISICVCAQSPWGLALVACAFSAVDLRLKLADYDVESHRENP